MFKPRALPRRAGASRRRRRNGFTLIELLVAVVLIEIGLLALVATGASLVRETTATRARFAATNAAANRLQLLGATPCANTNGVSNGATGLVEHWSADVTPNHIREISDSVTFVATGSTHIVVLRTRLPC
jgi:prepilin-type N-terminal cleavage/methylation domain-containing protein